MGHVEINVSRIVKKIDQIRDFNKFFTPSLIPEHQEIVNVFEEDKGNFKHLLTDLKEEIIKIINLLTLPEKEETEV